MNNESYINESVRGKIGQIIRKRKSELSTNVKWDKSVGRFTKKTITKKNVSENDYKMMKDVFDKIHDDNISYKEYRPLFNKICSFAGISPTGTVITKHTLKKGKENKNEFSITYSSSSTKVTIPADSFLYHKTSRKLEKNELKPFFKGRGKGGFGYLYETPRIYLTIRKKMLNFAADYKKNESKLYQYMVDEDVKYAYIDPLVWEYSFGAVYLDTTRPVKVKLVDGDIHDNSDVKKESVEYNIETESVRQIIGEKIRKINDKKEMNEKFNKTMNTFKCVDVTRELSSKEYKHLKQVYSTLKSKNMTFLRYKVDFNTICKYANISPQKSVISNVEFFEKDDKKFMRVEYFNGQRKVAIPNGIHLVQTSSKPIKECEPVFKTSQYLYPTARVYYKISEEILEDDSKSSIQKYTPKEIVRHACVDISYKEKGFVFIETNMPIPMMRLYDKIKKKFKNIDKLVNKLEED